MPVDGLSDAFVACLLPFLLETPVFKLLSRLQRTLDALDIEGLFSLHAASRTSASLERTFSDPTIDDWEQFVDTYLDPDFRDTLDYKNPGAEQLRYYTMAFLMSASFKDCSVIMRIPLAGGAPDSISVIDLDPKSMASLRIWLGLDRKLATSFRDDGQKRCIDVGMHE